MRARRLGFLLAAVLALIAASPARAGILITIDKSAQQMTVSVDGELRYTWPVSTGRRGYDTPNGAFGALSMEEMHYSKQWDYAPMPHSIFFTDEGHAIHGTLEQRNLGRPASHGCVRLSLKNATALFALVRKEGKANTTVTLTGVIPRSAAPAMVRRTNPAVRSASNDNGAAAYQPGTGLPPGYGAPARARYDYREPARSYYGAPQPAQNRYYRAGSYPSFIFQR
jgi:hypothetical protein